MQEDMKGWCR